MTVENMAKDLKQMREYLEKAASKPARSGAAGLSQVDKSYNPWRQPGMGGTEEWPYEKLKALGNAYSCPAAVDMWCRRPDGRLKMSGMGRALVKLAGMSGDPGSREIAKSQGLLDGNYGPEQLEREFGFTTVSKAAQTGIKGLNGEIRKVALAEGSGTTGGYIVPPQFMNELLTIAAEDSFIEPRAKIIPMASRTATWPMLDITTAQSTGVSPYFGGISATWQPEAATITETEPTFKLTEWTAWDLVMYTVSSNQLLADNGIGLDALLTSLFGQAITWFKEYAYLQGKGAGSSMPLGVLNAPATISQVRAVSNRFTLQDAAAMLSHLQVRSWDDACWIMHQSVIPQLIQLVDGGAANAASTTYIPGNQLAWMSPFGDGQVGPAAMKLPKFFLNGLPVFFTEKLPQLGTTGDVMLVDWSRYVIGMRLDLQIDVSPHFKFQNNQLAWRVIARCDGKPWINSYVTDAAGWHVSPFISLNSATS